MSHPKTECCGYEAPLRLAYPVYWNPFNKVVQCHNCGWVFTPAPRVDAIAQDILLHDDLLSVPVKDTKPSEEVVSVPIRHQSKLP